MGLCLDLAIAKTNKYASRESGDTAEVAERPGGGLSVVVADGQGSGRAAKTLSLTVTSKAVALLKEGVRDGAVSRAVHDALYATRYGQVSATLDILSVDLRSGTLVASRNATTPLLLRQDGHFTALPPEQGPIGLYPSTKPAVYQAPLAPDLLAILATDGVFTAGSHLAPPAADLAAEVAAWPPNLPAAALADRVLAAAIARDHGKPADDMTVVVLRLLPHDDKLLVRRLHVQFPWP